MNGSDFDLFMQAHPLAWIAGALVISAAILVSRPISVLDSDYLLSKTYTVPAIILVLGISGVFYGIIGWSNTYKLTPDKPPTFSDLNSAYYSNHSNRNLTTDSLQDTKVKAWCDNWTKMKTDPIAAQQANYNQNYGTFEYPPIVVSIPILFVGIVLVILGIIFLSEAYDFKVAEAKKAA